MSSDFYSYMGMNRVIVGPGSACVEDPPTGAAIRIALPIAMMGLATALAVPVAPTSASLPHAIRNENIAMSEILVEPGHAGVAAKLAYSRRYLSLNMKQMSEVLRVERPTVYAWLSEESVPHAANEARLAIIYKIADAWARASGQPLGMGLNAILSNGRSVLQMLKEPNVNVPEIRNVFAELQNFTSLSEVQRRGGERFSSARSLGYEKLSKRDATRRLRTNVPV